MWYYHELGEGWYAKDGTICSLEIHDDKVDVVDTEVVGSAKLDQ
jgi:hypothetical protein